MKKFLYLAMALCMGFAMTSCDDDDEIKTATLDFEGDYWTALIDNPQYNGELLYGENSINYAWTDELTGLSGGMTNAYGDGKYWGGGTAISNYVDADLTHSTWTYQLSVPTSNGSQNFAVVYCGASIHFDEGVNRTIQSMWVSPTTYQLGQTQTSEALQGAGSNLTLIITADNGAAVEVDLARDGNFLTTWKKIDLSSLGKVNSLTFSMDGTDKSSYGVRQPTYFAFDNVVVEME